MLFQFNSDNRVEGTVETEERVREIVESRLRHVSDRLTRVEVHVGDTNGPRGGVGNRCAVEIRPNGLEPITGTDTAETIEQAATGATDKALAAFERRIGKMTTRKGH
jgi:hypothetical protein